jgi:hypothetical protein
MGVILLHNEKIQEHPCYIDLLQLLGCPFCVYVFPRAPLLAQHARKIHGFSIVGWFHYLETASTANLPKGLTSIEE